MARPVDPQKQYTVKPHVTHSYTYASTQPSTIDEVTGKKRYHHIHWGKVIDGKFIPGPKYLLASVEERAKLIFPREWDLSELNTLSGTRPVGRPPIQGDNNRLYGDIWLLESIAEQKGVKEDLLSVFDGDEEIVDAILTLAIHPYLTSQSYNRVERWQRIVRAPYKKPLTPKLITLLSQSITEEHRMNFLRLRAQRLGKEEMCAVDSTSRSAFGSSLTDIRWGKNKDQLPLEQTNEVVVYTLSNHMPIYYRTFPGNMPDSRSLDTILTDLKHAGFNDYVLITDRGYESLKNLETLILNGIPALVCAKTGQKQVLQKIIELGDNTEPLETKMQFDVESQLFSIQYDLDYTVSCTNGREKKADRLKLNLYLDARRRTSILMNMQTEITLEERHLSLLKSECTPIDDTVTFLKSIKYFTVQFDPSNKSIASYSHNEEKIEKKKRLAGFFASYSHKLDFDAMKAYEHYNLRDEQEKYFQQMKDQMGADRQRNWSEDGKTGRLFILFVGLILSSWVRHVWKNKLKKSFSSSLEVLDEMRSIRCIEHKGHAKCITPFVGDQIEIAKAFEFPIPKGCDKQYVSKQKFERKRGRPRKPVVENEF